MNNKPMSVVAEDVITMILQDATFLFTEKLAMWEQKNYSVWKPLGSGITFSGATSGIFRLWVDEKLSNLMASNMLGIDEKELNKGKGADALKEILNMITGNFITAYYGESTFYEMGLPFQLNISDLKRDCVNSNSMWFSVEGYQMLAIVETVL